ncbi:MAG: hypothetical protein EAZ97_15720 [Bacteroidetes bacterium]|nr:MAG: hypothetical protein EAZ97_15720 [Bacteroidota bacterium]
MAEIKIDGRMTVRTLKATFTELFGAYLRVYVGNNAGRGARLAEENDRLSALADERESLTEVGAFQIPDDMTVSQFEEAFQKTFDIAVQVADVENRKLLDNNLKLSEVKTAE